MTATATVVRLYDEVGGPYGVSAADVIGELDSVRGDLELRISSPGGSATDGLAIYAELRRRPGTVRIVVDGLAASIASVIAQAASPGQLVASEGSVLMVHDAWAACCGDAAAMRDTADLLNKMSDNMASIYARRTGLPASAWREAMLAETWFTADEAVAARLVDRVA